MALVIIATLPAADRVRTVVLDGLSWRDIALGAALAFAAVLLLLALLVLLEKHRQARAVKGGGRPV